MVCVSLGSPEFDKCLKYIENYEFLEIRLDLCKFGINDLKKLSIFRSKLLISCHIGNGISQDKIFELLNTAIDLNFSSIDIDSNLQIDLIDKLISKARSNNVKTIVSYHNFNLTPSYIQCIKIIDDLFILNSDYIKFITFANHENDINIIKQLYQNYNNQRLISFCMGEKGRLSRLNAYKLDSPMNYVGLDGENFTADGQYTYSEFINLINNHE